ncbi:hypothetical protein [Mycobacterium sp.]|uniref:hypothetical protein n=1 Tax=Mycobacterium sp. TaxID=1785 RepID=UPI0031DCA9B4
MAGVRATENTPLNVVAVGTSAGEVEALRSTMLSRANLWHPEPSVSRYRIGTWWSTATERA